MMNAECRAKRRGRRTKILSSFIILYLSFISSTFAVTPTTDSTIDSILSLSQKAPATQPEATTQPLAYTPLKNQADEDQSRLGSLTMSDGSVIKGKIATTVDKPIRIWVEKEKDYEDIPLEQIASVEVEVLWERDEKEWNFKETGSDIKVYSGRTYPARQTRYKFTLIDGTIIEGDVVAPLYITSPDGKTKTYVLCKRDKGEIGQKLTDRTYVKSANFEK